MTRRPLAGLILVSACGVASFGQAAPAAPTAQAPATEEQETPKAAALPTKNDYSKGETWLCRPGRQDACAVDLATTVVSADGKLTPEAWAADPSAPIDCFYVYPTVSRDPSGNSDMIPGSEERGVIQAQFARFASKCRPYAPLYRQVTLTALRAAAAGSPIPVDRALAYGDVLDAWNYYLEHDNHGRGVVLVGHSQGASVLTALIKYEIDGKPVQSRIVSALLLGTSLPVPKGKDVGGAFQHVPLCHAATQTGCVITYATFRATDPPPLNTRFGKVTGDGMISGCTNPAALAGGSGELHAYLRGSGLGFVSSSEAVPGPWVKSGPPITTPFVRVPGLLTGECVSNDSGSYLAVSVHGDPAGPRASDITGDVVVGGQVLHDWGLHLIDVNVAMGNLLEIVEAQGKAYLAATKK
ncbi:MAG TPA: DUF3089 domain-containing protein [Candidatus Dormibacteraeota bacterium]|nr:DUF3089 domain-containing protein [Candidatus Dormibacteraeota bacterium]